MARTFTPTRIRMLGRCVFAGLFLSAFVLVHNGVRTARAADEPSPSCVSVTSEARYSGYGYNHLVRITNGCEQPVACTVSTDVNPAPEQVTVHPNETLEVVTFRGSPAREFVPHVRCRSI